MTLPDWRKVALDEGILRELTLDPQHLVLWLPRGSEGALRHWERIGNLPGAPVVALQGLGATAATSVRASQRVRSFFGKLFGRRQPPGDQTWMLPGGGVAEQEGERQTDRLLVWAEDERATLDETQVRDCLPAAKAFQRLGKNLVLVAGLEASALREPPRPAPACPREEAERLLAAARQGGDPRRLVFALTDLGVLYSINHEEARAVPLLQEALAAVGQGADPVAEADVRGNLGLALLSDNPQQALEFLDQALTLARSTGDGYAEKLALVRQATAVSRLRDHARALALYAEARALRRALGDWRHEADLLWLEAVQHAELGQRALALALGQMAVDLLTRLNDPHVRWFADNLRRYAASEDQAASGTPVLWPPTAGGAVVLAGGETLPPAPAQATGPGLLRMAFAAATAMTQYVSSGLKRVPAETRRRRLQTCAACEHHTGLRCRVCGCFTSAKTWMVHERCPLGKWSG